MPIWYELIGYNIPQLCAWELGFSPLNARTTSGGERITAALPPALGAASGGRGQRRPVRGRWGGLRGHPRVPQQPHGAAAGHSVLWVEITPGESPPTRRRRKWYFFWLSQQAFLILQCFLSCCSASQHKKHIQYLVCIECNKIVERLPGISSEVSCLGNRARTGAFFIPT